MAFFTLGTRGDVEPMVALAKGFADAGHDVRFISDQGARSPVPPSGIPCHFLQGNLTEWFSGPFGRELWRSRDHYRLMRALAGLYADFVPVWMQDAADAMRGCRLLIMSKATLGLGHALAEKTNAIPCEAALAPAIWSRHIPSPLLPVSCWSLPGGVRRILYEASVRGGWLGMRGVTNAARRALGLTEVSWPFGRRRPALLDAVPQLYGFSPTLVPHPPDWPRNIAITGFWHRQRDGSSEPSPRALAAFLEAGPKPVYVGFGSAIDGDPAGLREIVLRAIRDLGVRAIVSTGWGTMAGTENADDILVVDEVSHDWVFPRVAAVVCHGGAGTVAATLRAGTPAVVVPYIYDQPLWGWALARAGIAPRMIPRRHLSVERLKAALRQAIADGAMRERATEVSERVRAEDGVQRAVEVIHNWLSPALVGWTTAKPPLSVADAKPV